MSGPAAAHPPLVSSAEVVRDIDAVVDWLGKRHGHTRVTLFGWAIGGHWAGYNASPEDVKQLAADLVNASVVKALTIPGATHWVHLDRSERGRSMLVEQVIRFVRASAPRNHNSAGKITGSQEK